MNGYFSFEFLSLACEHLYSLRKPFSTAEKSMACRFCAWVTAPAASAGLAISATQPTACTSSTHTVSAFHLRIRYVHSMDLGSTGEPTWFCDRDLVVYEISETGCDWMPVSGWCGRLVVIYVCLRGQKNPCWFVDAVEGDVLEHVHVFRQLVPQGESDCSDTEYIFAYSTYCKKFLFQCVLSSCSRNNVYIVHWCSAVNVLVHNLHITIFLSSLFVLTLCHPPRRHVHAHHHRQRRVVCHWPDLLCIGGCRLNEQTHTCMLIKLHAFSTNVQRNHA